jgi:outer membrane protein OmpA-like peptidoglycan-associated protein
MWSNLTRNSKFIRSLTEQLKTKAMKNLRFINAFVMLFVLSMAHGQNIQEKTHVFYFDTDVSNRLRADQELQITDDDDGWLNGRIKQLKVIGYADCQGNKEHNQVLSDARARFIAKNLVKLGVVDEDFPIEIVGGGALPCIERSGQGDPSNRRVEVWMLYTLDEEKVIEELPAEMVETGKVELVGVNFQPGRHVLLPESIVPLDKFYEVLKAHPELKIELQGHICCQPFPGDGMDNDTGIENLSAARAKAIYDYLIQKGIDANRLRFRGMGNYYPKVDPEITEEDRIANRRVEAVLWE